MSSSQPPLSPKQEAFCREFCVDWNGSQAAIRAGYSSRTAKEQSTRLLTKVHIQARIAQLQRPQLEKLEISAEKVLAHLSTIAFADIVITEVKPADKVRALSILIDRVLDVDLAIALLDKRGFDVVPKILPTVASQPAQDAETGEGEESAGEDSA